MSKTIGFLKAAGVFFVTTVNSGKPACRPFGAASEIDGELYISTSVGKDVYNQMKASPAVQIVAMLPNSIDWVRIDGNVTETDDLRIKQAMLNDCPVLLKHFPSCESEDFAAFRIADAEAHLYTGGRKEEHILE